MTAPSARERVAAGQRDRMRKRLLDAMLELVGPAGGRGVVVDDVVRKAGVARGTFYRHFATLDEAFEALVSDLVEEIVVTATTLFGAVDDAILAFALGNQLLLDRAASDPNWARLVSSNSLMVVAPPLRAVLDRTLERGRAAGAFEFASLTAATDLFGGALLAGIRRAADMPPPQAYIEALTVATLQSLAVTPDRAKAAVAAARRRISEAQPDIPWARTGSG